MRRRSTEECWEVDFYRIRDDHIAEANIHLEVDTRLAQEGFDASSDAAVLRLFADFLNSNAVRQKLESVVADFEGAKGLKAGSDGFGAGSPIAEQVEISRRPVGLPTPNDIEHGAFKNEAIAVR